MTTARTYADTSRDILARIASTEAEVWPSKFETLDDDGVFKLLHYYPLVKEEYRTPILIVYAFINRPYVLDMEPQISVVREYLLAGFDVYMIDWGYPTSADRYVDLDDYMEYLGSCVRLIKQRKRVDSITVHGYCLGGTLSTAYSAVRQGNIKNLVLQAAPIDFHTENTISAWARTLDPEKITNIYHLAPGEFLNTGFLLVDPVKLIVGKYAGFLEMTEPAKGMSSFLRMDKWIFDSPAIPGAAYRQYINEWYHQNLLLKGEFKALRQQVDLRQIKCPLLVLVAKYDHIAPPESQKPIIDIVSSRDKDIFEIAKGHIGITTSKDSHKEFWPKVVEWIKQRSEVKKEVRYPEVSGNTAFGNMRSEELSRFIANTNNGGDIMDNMTQSYYQNLYEIAADLNSVRETETIPQILVDKVAKAMDAKGCSLMLLSPDKKSLVHQASSGLSDWYIRKGVVSTDKSISEALDGKPIAVVNASDDDRIQYPEENKKEGIASILSVPMMLRDQAIGVIRIYSAERRHFTEDDMYFVGAVANLSAIALENARICEFTKPDQEVVQATW